MAMKLLGDLNIRELYSNILEECPVYRSENEEICEIAKNILQEIFVPYLKVRPFSYAKDINNKHKLKKTFVKLRLKLSQLNQRSDLRIVYRDENTGGCGGVTPPNR